VPSGRTSRGSDLHCSKLRSDGTNELGKNRATKLKLTSSNFLLISNLSVQIAAISVVHDDTQAALVHEGLLVGDDIRVPHGFEYVDLQAEKSQNELSETYLIYGVFTLLTVHF